MFGDMRRGLERDRELASRGRIPSDAASRATLRLKAPVERLCMSSQGDIPAVPGAAIP